VLAEIKLNGEIASVLLNKATPENRLAPVYALIRQYEAGKWDSLGATADQLNIPRDTISELYLESVAWSEKVFRC
jgi:c-di-GMP-related signal transduction protein